MSKRWAWFLAVAVLLLFAILFRERRGSALNEHPPPQEAAGPTPAGSESLTNLTRASPSGNVGSATTAPAGGARAQRIEQALSARNVTVDFWGKVVDQDNAPLAGVHVEIRVRHWGKLPGVNTAATQEKYSRETGADGTFHVTGASGDSLSIETVQKDGYLLSPKATRGFSYLNRDPNLPEKDSPYVFRMWKKSGSEELKKFRVSRMIPYDGKPVWIDLREGSISEGDTIPGDLKITLQRVPHEIALTNREPFDWRADITAVSGGIVSSDDEFMYLAPAEGYLDHVEIAMPRTAAPWVPNKQVSLFVKGPGGSYYGRITMEFRVNYSGPKTGFTIDAVLNPNGSRHLEP